MIEPASEPKTARVIRKLANEFPSPEARTAAEASLDAFLESASGAKSERVLLAILKLSAGDRAKLQHAIESASRDPRDVIAWAEYPEEMLLDGDEEPAVLDAARARDLEQYTRWLNERAAP